MSRGKKRPAAVPDRPSWDEYFMTITSNVAERSTCMRRKVGAVLVREKRILATGYNGAPRGLPHCSETGCLRRSLNVPSGQRHELCRGLHAEMNAFLQAAEHGVRIEGSALYSTTHPCSLCTKMLINVGIVRVIYAGGYPDEMSREMLAASGIQVEQASPPERGGTGRGR